MGDRVRDGMDNYTCGRTKVDMYNEVDYSDEIEIVCEDTPPSSPDMDNNMDEDIVPVIDIDEVIDTFDDRPDDEVDDAMDEELQEKDDSILAFTGHKRGSVFCCSLSKNGKIAATGAEDDKAYVWDTASGEIFFDCTGHKDSVIYVEFNFDQTYLATGDMSGTIQVWSMADKSRVWEYNMGDATWMKWHASANVLFAGSVDGEVYMWKVPGGDCKVLQGHGCRVETAIVLPDGKRIAVGYEDGTIRVLDLKTNLTISSLPPNVGHSTTVTALDCHSDNNLILSTAVDGKTILSVSHTGKIVSILQNLNIEKESNESTMEDEGNNSAGNDRNWVETAAFCKDPSFQVAATGTVKGDIFIWDIAKQILRQKLGQDSGISKLVWKGTTSLFFSAGLDGILRCFDARISQCIQIFTGHLADILDLYISEDEKTALTASDDSTARVFDISCVT